jgi:hypothetical protein
MIFLIEFDRASGRTVGMTTFPDPDLPAAREKLLQRELEMLRAGAIDREVVILAATDEAALRKTHGRYFVERGGIAGLMARG